VTGKHSVNVVQTRRQARLSKQPGCDVDSHVSVQCETRDNDMSPTNDCVQPRPQITKDKTGHEPITRGKNPHGKLSDQSRYVNTPLSDVTDTLINDPNVTMRGPQTDVTNDELGARPRRKVQRQNKPVGLLGRTAPTAATVMTDMWSHEKLRQQQLDDRDIAPALGWAQTGCRPNWKDVKGTSPALRALWQQFHSLIIVNGVLHRIFMASDGEVKHYQIVLPYTLRLAFLELIHCDFCGHLGFSKCALQLQPYAWWYNWKRSQVVHTVL